MKTPLTSGRLKQHLTYGWWVYVLIAVLAFGLVDLLYVVTRYRPPEDKVVDFYIYGLMAEEPLTEYMDHVRETEMSDMEELSPIEMSNDSTYGPMQLTTYLAAGEGDVYLLPREQFLSFAAAGSLLPLEGDAELLAIFDSAGVSLQSGWRRDEETGENHLYGIPQSKLPGLSRYAYAEDGYVCVIVTSGNPDNARKFIRILSRDCISEPTAEESGSSD